jgi:hypothetical protein
VLVRGDGQPAGEHAPVAGAQLALAHRHRDKLALADAQLDARAHQPGVEPVVVAIDAHVRIRRHPRDHPPIGVGRPVGQRPERPALIGEAVERAAAQRAMDAGVGVVTPAIEPMLAVELVGEHPARLEVGAQIAAAVLDQPVGLRIARLEDRMPQALG